jgi:endonuclease YncB( thermonuclease family)
MAKLTSVVDGNTLDVVLRGQPMRVRLYGVVVPPADDNRPILARLNKESAAFLKKYLEAGWLYLEFPGGTPKPDEHNVVPAFVYRGSDATFLNEKLVAEGLAITNGREECQFTEKFRASQSNANATARGIWGSFEGGDGEKIASGIPNATYIGVGGRQQSRGSSYVTYWIIFYR